MSTAWRHAANITLVERADACTTMALPMIVAYINDSTYMTIPTESILSINYTISEGAVKKLGKLVRVLTPFSSFVEDLAI